MLAFDYNDMPGLYNNLVVHNLSVSPEFKPVKKRIREFPRARKKFCFHLVDCPSQLKKPE